MIKSTIFILVLIFEGLAFAAAAPTYHLPDVAAKTFSEVEELPVRLVRLHLNSIEEGICTDIVEQLESVDAYSWRVDDYTTLYAVPCALWAYNQSWKIYAEFNEPRGDSFGMFRRLNLSALDLNGDFVGSDIVYDWVWSGKNQTLAMAFFNNGRPDCGSLHQYSWNNVSFQFELKSARLKTKCDGDTSLWPEVQLPRLP